MDEDKRLELHPEFRTERKGRHVRLFLMCSLCKKDLRELKNKDKVDVSVLHFCDDCFPKNKPPILNT